MQLDNRHPFTSGSPFLEESRNYDVQYTHDPQGLKEYNKDKDQEVVHRRQQRFQLVMLWQFIIVLLIIQHMDNGFQKEFKT